MLLTMIVTISGCSSKNILLFLNWGEYIDEELLEKFEEKYNCTVVMDLGESNEIFYSKVRSGTTIYDVVCPSDYMVEKMYFKDMLLEMDFSKLPNYNKDSLSPGVKHIIS
jgi:spermidine/putrescine-binding protein